MAARLIPSLSVPAPQATNQHDAGTARSNRSHPMSPEDTPMTTPVWSRSLRTLLVELGTRAECRFDPELHTGPDTFTTEPAAERMARMDAARAVCDECPVWDLCLDYALRLPSVPKGSIWAGYTAAEIADLKRQARALGEVA